MTLFIWVCIALAACPITSGMYYTKLRQVFKPPGPTNNHSFFGYSITHDTMYKRLIISAPNNSQVGDVYDCDINIGPCKRIVHNIVPEFKDYSHNYWFGATVKAGPDFVMMCAPRYTEHYIHVEHRKRHNSYVTFGKCFSLNNNELVEKDQISEEDRDREVVSPMEAKMDSFGWSIDIGTDDSVIIGGPGMFHGRAMVYKKNKFPMFIRKNKDTPEFNFGYAVAASPFIDNELSYAVSSTYGNKGEGQVLFFNKELEPRHLNLVKKVDKNVIGSMFGAVLCSAKLTGHKTDLLVGAPAYATKSTYNLGAIYVFIATKLKKQPQYLRRVLGLESGSLFGSAIVSLGDLNGDLRHEIAIGAPFENSGHGVVYVYSGSALIDVSTGDLPTIMQKLLPEPSYAPSFGMSLTPLVDYDHNGCYELAVGSPFTEQVVLFNCFPALNVTTIAVDFPDFKGRTTKKETLFAFKICLLVNIFHENVTASLSTTVEITHTYAKLKKPNDMDRFTFITTLVHNKLEYCTPVEFFLPLDGKYETEIGFHIKTKLQEDPMKLKTFNSSLAILSDISTLELKVSMWAAECEGNKICVPNLDMSYNVSFLNSVKEYIIGSSQIENININISNSGDIAYDACVRVHFIGVPLLKYPNTCEYEVSDDGVRLICAPPSPLLKDEYWATGEIELDMKLLTNLNKNLTFDVDLYDHCTTKNPKNYPIVIPMKADRDGIIATGETDIGALVNMTKEDVQTNGKKFQHIYMLSNNGKTNWVSLPIEVILAKKNFIKYDPDAVTVFSEDISKVSSSAECKQFEEDEQWIKYNCMVDSLKSSLETAKILIPMFVVPGTLDAILETENMTVISKINIYVEDRSPNERYKSISLITTIMLKDATVPLEWIIGSVIVGLIILIIIAIILYKVGFLRRQKRKELNNLRKSVRRQTILRRSTMPTQTQSDERRQILDEMKEETEVDLSKS